MFGIYGINRFTRRRAISVQSQSWNMVLTNYLLTVTVSHLECALDIRLLWYYYFIITWYNFGYYLKPWLVVICICSAFSFVAFVFAAVFGE